MRLWTLHPRHLDAKGLVALWREGLLARAVLCGHTKGYTWQMQLERFRACAAPVAAVDAYLAVVCDEADARGYRFDRGKLAVAPRGLRLPASDGQLDKVIVRFIAQIGPPKVVDVDPTGSYAPARQPRTTCLAASCATNRWCRVLPHTPPSSARR